MHYLIFGVSTFGFNHCIHSSRPELLIHLYFPTYRPVPTRLFIGNCLFGKVKLQFRSVIGPGSGTVSIFPILVSLLFSKCRSGPYRCLKFPDVLSFRKKSVRNTNRPGFPTYICNGQGSNDHHRRNFPVTFYLTTLNSIFSVM